jgi:hypothetical protein
MAIDLAQRGIQLMVAEARGEPPSVKCNRVGARTWKSFVASG